MTASFRRASVVLALALLVAACDTGHAAVQDLSAAARQQAVAAATALDQTWNQAAEAGDVAAVLACFRAGESFRFSYRGGLALDHARFVDLTERSFAGRKALRTVSSQRDVRAITADVAAVAGTARYELTPLEGDATEIDVAYGFTCSRAGDGWKIAHAHEYELR